MSAKRRGVGGTDVGPIVALYMPHLADELAKYATASDVWLRIVHDIERPRTAVMGRGIDAEPRLRRAYLDAYGGTFDEKPTPWIVPHPRFPWATCSPDDVVTRDGERRLVEYKSTSIFARHKYGDAETDAIPYAYLLQTQWCMEILDLDACDVFVGFGRDFKDEHDAHQFLYESTARYLVQRDRELAAMCLDLCGRFQRDFVETRRPPSVAPASNKRAFARLLKECA